MQASLSGTDRPSARVVSNAVSAQQGSHPNSRNASDYLWQWGQFLDHDIDLTDGTEPPEPANIAVPSGDAWFDPDGNGGVTISLHRSIYDIDSGTGTDNPCQQLNEITAWIDASNVYGSNSDRQTALRSNDGSGRLRSSDGDLPLRNAFFAPYRLADEGGIAPILRGLASQTCQDIDTLVVDDVRNFLFGEPGQGGFDLVSLNIQRGRDYGLPSYNDARRAMGLTPATAFSDISSDAAMQQRLADAYATVEMVDAWVGVLAEDHVPQALLGELNSRVLVRQYEALRDGDRFWYQAIFQGEELDRIERTRLSDIIRRNTDIGDELQRNVFLIGS